MKGFIVYNSSDQHIHLNASKLSGPLTVHWIDPKSGRIIKEGETFAGGSDVELKSPQSGAIIMWATTK